MEEIEKADVERKTGDSKGSDQRVGLKDMGDVKIAPELSYKEKVHSYVQQIGNPYRYRDKGFVVELSFAGGSTFEERLAEYMKNRSK
ncbi:MAG: hypothetical protein LUE92_10955 [Clostridiales bacterium]|nr:hypothetical protein [Clostridiales bacterium]